MNLPGESRLIILAPLGRDAALIAATLEPLAVECVGCSSLDLLLHELRNGAGALMVAEEALGRQMRALEKVLAEQPPWSDLPVLILTRPGADSVIARQALTTLGNVTLLERPLRRRALVSAVLSATRARRRQYQARALLAEREDANQKKDAFLATLAHELRNPLAPIRNVVAIMKATGLDRAPADTLEILERQTATMIRLVDDLMDVSRLTLGKVSLRTDALDLRHAVAVAIETSRPDISARGHRLTVDLGSVPLPVRGDEVRLTQVFTNLLNNAVRYSNDGGAIAIRAWIEEKCLCVAVTDQGWGLSADAIASMFDMFTQGNPEHPSARMGLGLGLALVRTLVEAHGGDVSAHSEGQGCGSQFLVTLPLSQQVSQDLEVAADPQPAGNAFSGKRVLIVDDNVDAAESLAVLLSLGGAVVEVRNEGNDGLSAFDAARPDIVILDLGMPGMDGYEVARRIRASEYGALPFLIALTGWGEDAARMRTAEAGFDRHLVKPVDYSQLCEALRS